MLVETGLMACASIQTQSIGFRRRLLALFTLAVSIGNASCILGVSSIRGTPAPQREPLQDQIEVVITIKGQICTAENLAGLSSMELNRSGGTCPPDQLGNPDYYPAEVLANIPGSIVSPRVHERGLSYYTPDSVPANVSQWTRIRKELGFSAVHPKDWHSETPEISPQGALHRTFASVADWQRFRNRKLRKTLLIQLEAVSEQHWSMWLSAFTLGLFPGYQEHKILMRGLYYDAAGKIASIEPARTAKFNEWNHILLIFWGPLYTVLSKNYPYGELARDIFNQIPDGRP